MLVQVVGTRNAFVLRDLVLKSSMSIKTPSFARKPSSKRIFASGNQPWISKITYICIDAFPILRLMILPSPCLPTVKSKSSNVTSRNCGTRRLMVSPAAMDGNQSSAVYRVNLRNLSNRTQLPRNSHQLSFWA